MVVSPTVHACLIGVVLEVRALGAHIPYFRPLVAFICFLDLLTFFDGVVSPTASAESCHMLRYKYDTPAFKSAKRMISKDFLDAEGCHMGSFSVCNDKYLLQGRAIQGTVVRVNFNIDMHVCTAECTKRMRRNSQAFQDTQPG